MSCFASPVGVLRNITLGIEVQPGHISLMEEMCVWEECKQEGVMVLGVPMLCLARPRPHNSNERTT